jgi:hypothetical protein
MRCAALALWLLGCGARPHTAPAAIARDEVTLYRDRALVRQRVEVVVPPTGTAMVAIKIAAGVGPDDLVILDRGELAVSELRVTTAPPSEPGPARDARVARAEPAEDPVEREGEGEGEGEDEDEDEGEDKEPEPPRAATASSIPTELTLVIGAPRAGRFALSLGYATDRLAWDAAYTLTTTASRDRAVVRGAVAIRNTSGIALQARAYLVDAELGAWRDHVTQRFGGALAGMASTTPGLVHPRDLGIVTLGDGETRVELLTADPPRTMRTVMVYDPIGTRLDHAGSSPISRPTLGVEEAAPTRVIESFEIDRDERATRGLPAGPVRLLERHPDGSLAVLGESRLFEAATRGASADTVAIGTADGVIGHRERRGWAKDDDQKRFSEEFLLTIDNARSRPVEIVLREHLYRGQNWTLAYQSAPAAKEGPQQISLRVAVPAHGHAKVLYVVVYTW